MCEFISWIEYYGGNKTEIFYLNNDILRSKKGKKLLEPNFIDDVNRHGAILHYYKELKKDYKKMECVNFSTPKNFPEEVVKDFKDGKMSLVGIETSVLLRTIRSKFQKLCKKSEEEFHKKRKELNEQLRKIIEELDLEKNNRYYKICSKKERKIDKITSDFLKSKISFSKKERLCKDVRERYDAENYNSDDLYWRKREKAEDEIEGKQHELRLERKIKQAEIFSKLIKVKKNRIKRWR